MLPYIKEVITDAITQRYQHFWKTSVLSILWHVIISLYDKYKQTNNIAQNIDFLISSQTH